MLVEELSPLQGLHPAVTALTHVQGSGLGSARTLLGAEPVRSQNNCCHLVTANDYFTRIK